MSKRLQVLLAESELAEIRRAARQENMTVAEWVRRALRTAQQLAPGGDPRKKLQTVRAATEYSFPAGDIDTMLAEIEVGYSGSEPR